MEVTFAKALSDEQSDAIHKNYSNRNAKRKELSVKWCAENESRIISDHNKYEDYLKNTKYKEYCDEIKKSIDNYNSKVEQVNSEINEVYELADHLENGGSCKCSCVHEGQMVRRTGPTYDFIGCSKFNQPGCEKQTHNFRKPVALRSYDDEIMSYDEWLDYEQVNWTYIKKITVINNYPKFVRASDVFRTLKVNDVSFYCDVTEDNFNTGVKASMQSKDEENALFERLKKIPNCKAKHRTNFIYRVKDDSKEHRCETDFILYNKNKIVILDAKKNIDSCNMDQLDKYTKVVRAACKTPIDVKAYHILFDRSNASPDDLERNQVLTLNDIKNEFN